jgi:hypothetical protein
LGIRETYWKINETCFGEKLRSEMKILGKRINCSVKRKRLKTELLLGERNQNCSEAKRKGTHRDKASKRPVNEERK